MTNVIQHRRNTGTGNVPTTGQLAIAELAINTYDGRLWFKANNGSDYLREVATLNGTQTLSNKSIVGGSAIELTAFSVRSSGSAFDVAIASAEVLTADRTLTLSLGDANRTLTLSGDATISGTNTGDQTTISGNAGTATTLATARSIYGSSFNGSADLTGIIASTFGGTGNGFTKFTGAASTEKTYTLPNATCTILTTNAAVTVAQGGTGATTLTGVLIGNGTSAVTATSILTAANGGTGNGFTAFSGATTSTKTYTLPNATCTILTDNAAVTVAQGGTGATTLTGILKGNGTSAFTAVTAPSGTIVGTTDTQTLTNKFLTPRVATLTDGATPALDASTGDVFLLTAAGNRTIAVPSNAVSGQSIIIVHKASAADRTLALNTGAGGFRFGTDITGLTATTNGKTDYIGCVYNSADSKWDVVAYTKGF